MNTHTTAENTFDAIVVGSGISGGWAAKELCEKGFKTLVLERGRNVDHIKDYPTALKHPWEFTHHLFNTNRSKAEDPIQSQAYDEGTKHFFVRDKEHPYIQETPFSWVRGYQVGGKSLTWGRQTYRLSDLDFEANLKENIGVDWPIRYKDIEPWYSYVEKFVGISGKSEGLAHLPDGEFLPPIEMNCVEDHFAKQTNANFQDIKVINGRVANLTKGLDGRGPCQFRNLCARGCPFSGYFSSNAATLPAAKATGNLTLRPFSIVKEILYDQTLAKATGVRIIDATTNEVIDFYGRIIFLNAGTIPTASILLNSKSEHFPDGIGNSSKQVGHNLMDHFVIAGAEGEFDGFHDKYYSGRNPGSIYIPRFRNINERTKQKDFVRGYGFQGKAYREEWRDLHSKVEGFGKNYKNQLLQPKGWKIWIGAWGETLPYYSNRVELDETKKDKWGLPLVKINFEYHENEKAMRKDIEVSAREMLEKAGFKNVSTFNNDLPGGSAIHEMGTARMGRDPKTSVLNEHNQMHEVKNVFITDGSCMTSSANQHPSLTYMALTARACAYASEEVGRGNL